MARSSVSGGNEIAVISVSEAEPSPRTTASPALNSNILPKDKPRTSPQYLASFACAGGGFAYGTVVGWISPASSKWYASGGSYMEGRQNCTLSRFAHHDNVINLIQIKSVLSQNGMYLDTNQFSWVVTVFALGAALTAVPSGLMLQYLGRKITIFIFLLPLVVGWMLLMFAGNFLTILIGRLLLGISCGTSSVIVPIYNAEISVPQIRGRTGALYQTMVNTGILFMMTVGPFVNLPMLVFISALVTMIFYIMFYFAPESPTFLMSRGLEEEAQEALRRLRGSHYDPTPELQRLRKELDESESSSWAALKRTNTLRGLAITCGLMVFFQMSGINALIYFATTIFEKADSPLSTDAETIITGTMQLVGTIFTVIIVDRAGRRILLLASAVTCAFSTLIIGVFFEAKARDPDSTLAYAWLPLVSMCAFFLLFSMGYGPISWIIMGEVFDVDIKGLASSISVSLNFVLSFLVTKGAFHISAHLGVGGMFWMFSGFSVAGIVFIIIVVPETKNKTFAEIQRMLTLYNYG